jgi:hypothetical protein
VNPVIPNIKAQGDERPRMNQRVLLKQTAFAPEKRIPKDCLLAGKIT